MSSLPATPREGAQAASQPFSTLPGVLALACWQLGARLGLLWVVEQQRAGRDNGDTHALACTHPRVRLPFHFDGVAASPAEGAGPDAEENLAAAGLAPSAALRVVPL